MKHLLVGALSFLVASAARAETGRVFAETQQSGDSDGARQHTYYTGYRTPAQGPGADLLNWEIAAGTRLLSAPAGTESFAALRTTLKGKRNGIQGELRLNPLFSEGWTPFLGAALLSSDSGAWHLEASAERELVDTVTAVRARNLLHTYSVSADRLLNREFTLTGLLLKQNFDDGNDRIGGLLRLAYSPESLEGFSTQLRARRVDGDFRGVGYFSPLRLEEYTLVVRYSRPVWRQRLRLTGQVSGGAQRVDNTDTNPIYSAELRLRGFLTEHVGLESQLGMANTGGLDAGAGSSGYRYNYGNLSLIYAW